MELWTRCPKAEEVRVAIYPVWACECHGVESKSLVRVPFDEAVERMLDEWCDMADSSVGSGPSGYDRGRLRPVMCYLLTAAAGLTHAEADRCVRAALGEKI